MLDQVRQWWSDPVMRRFGATLVGLLVIVATTRFARRSAGRYVRDADLRYRTRKFVGMLGWVAVLLLLAAVYSDRLRGLTVAFGVAGVGIAFALQEIIASVAGWVAVLFGGFYAPGDRVQLGGIKGDVIDIGVLRTTLMECGQWVDGDLYNGRIVRVANSFVFKEPVVNYSADFPFLWDEIKVPVKYGSDRPLAQDLLTRIVTEDTRELVRGATATWDDMIRKYRIEPAQIAPFVTLVANDNWLEYTVRYIVDYRRRRATKDRLFNRILDEIDASAGRVALASATFHLVETPAIRVTLEPAAPATAPGRTERTP